MTKQEFLTHLEDILEADAGSVTGDEALTDLAGWDSLAVMAFIAMVDEKFDVVLSASKLAGSKNVGDLIALLGDKISG
ncbi:acyl carrier protein [Verrucomicrobiota bacterium]